MTKSTPMVTVLMTAFNAERFIADAIESILRQTFKDFEFIIINDGSRDNTLKIIRSFKDKRIVLVTHHNKGRQASLDEGVSMSSGKYIALMDADDIASPDRLEKQISHLERHPDCAAVSSFIRIIDAEGRELEPWEADRNNVTTEQIRKTLPAENCIANPASVIRSNVLKRFGYRHDQVSEDYDLWLRLISNGYQVHKLALPLLSYRILPDSITQTSIGGSVNRKNLNFKLKFLKDQLLDKKVGKVELQVGVSLVKLIWIMAWKKTKSDTFQKIKIFDNSKSKNARKILFILPWLDMGGADKVALDVIEALKKKRYTIYCATTSPSKNAWRKSFEPFCERIYDVSHLPMHIGIAEALANYSVADGVGTVLISNSVSGYVAAEIIKKDNPDVKVVDIVHGQGGKKENGGVPLHSAPYDRFVDKRIVVTEYMKKYLIQEYGISPQKITTIHNGTEIPNTRPPKPAHAMKENSGKFIVLWAGRLNDEKHPELVLDIAKKLINLSDRLHFVLAGEGENKAELIKQIYEEGLDKLITISPEPYSDYRTYVYYADLLLMTSEMEGLPIIILEAYAEHKPVIAAGVGGIPEVVKNGWSGYLYNFDDEFVDNVSEKLKYIIEHREVAEIMGERGFKTVSKKFTLDEMQKKYVKAIEG